LITYNKGELDFKLLSDMKAWLGFRGFSKVEENPFPPPPQKKIEKYISRCNKLKEWWGGEG
jgi:hypothetical protein